MEITILHFSITFVQGWGLNGQCSWKCDHFWIQPLPESASHDLSGLFHWFFSIQSSSISQSFLQIPLFLCPLQKALKEKEEHIEQLIRERELERSEVFKASLQKEEVCLLSSIFINLYGESQHKYLVGLIVDINLSEWAKLNRMLLGVHLDQYIGLFLYLYLYSSPIQKEAMYWSSVHWGGDSCMPELHATRSALALVLICDDHPDTRWSNMSQSEVNSFRFIKWVPEFVSCVCMFLCCTFIYLALATIHFSSCVVLLYRGLWLQGAHRVFEVHVLTYSRFAFSGIHSVD